MGPTKQRKMNRSYILVRGVIFCQDFGTNGADRVPFSRLESFDELKANSPIRT
jgi:hypothetical protein